MKDAEEATEDFADASLEASVKNIEMLTSMEAVTGSLNQIVGGYSKVGGSLETLGVLTEGQTEIFNKSRAAMELMIGPIEMGMASIKLMSAARVMHTNVMASETVVQHGLTKATWMWTVALLTNPIVLVIAGLIAMVAVMILLEKKFGLVTKTFDGLNDAFDRGIAKMKEFKDNTEKLFKILTDPLGSSGIGKLFMNEKHGGS